MEIKLKLNDNFFNFLKELKSKKIIVGVMGKERAGIAMRHEFGYGVPSRPFLFPAVMNRVNILKSVKEGVRKKNMVAIGLSLENSVRERLDNLSNDPLIEKLSPITIQRKGSSKVLVDKGLLRSSISSKII